MIDNLEGQKILFIGIGFYDYEDVIKRALEGRGAIVTYISSIYSSLTTRTLKRLKLDNAVMWLCQKEREKLIKKTPRNNNIVFVIKGDQLSKRDIDKLHQSNPDARFILYLWDSLVRHDSVSFLLENFSNIWSFDRIDCEKNPILKFRPLFYRSILPKQSDKYALSFIGWMHCDRLKIARTLKEQLIERGWDYYIKLYTGLFQFYCGRLSWNYFKSDTDIVIFKPLSYNEFQTVTSSSDMVLDIAHELQSGLTIRTIEALAAGCHLLTTNIDIVNYPQIQAECYTIVDRKNLILPGKIHKGIRMKEEFVNYFSLDCFIEQIFLRKNDDLSVKSH